MQSSDPTIKIRLHRSKHKRLCGQHQKHKAPIGYVAISFDVVSLFTNVPLRDTINIIFKKVYDEQLIKTKITRKNLEKLLLVCTQGTPLTFNNKMYMQTDGVRYTIIPSLGDKVCQWKCYVDDTFAFIKPNTEQEINILITRENDGKMETGVYRKPTHIDEYLNWNAHAPNIWKTSILFFY